MATIDILSERIDSLEKQLALLLSDKACVPEKKSKKTKNHLDDEKPKKKRTSGYILYSNAHRDEVKETLTQDDEKPKNTDIMKTLATNWKALTEEDREKWNAKAKEIKDD
tara:strand:+ start:116 stop:445 length:330 start_codon:yes stop_codon:yes gene_type:complete